MRTSAHLATALAALVVLGLATRCGGDDEEPAPAVGATTTMGGETEPSATPPDPILESSAFAEGEPIPVDHTCDGANTSPPLTWVDLPEGTQSVAIWVDDPDAPGGTFTHWTGWGIDPASGGLDAGAAAPVEGANDARGTGYFGPCPPSGDGPHRYVFHLYALDSELDLEAGADASAFMSALGGKVLGEAAYVGTFER